MRFDREKGAIVLATRSRPRALSAWPGDMGMKHRISAQRAAERHIARPDRSRQTRVFTNRIVEGDMRSAEEPGTMSLSPGYHRGDAGR